MAHYLAYATKAGTTQPQKVLIEVLQMLEAGIWGVPATAQLKMKLTPGDGLLVAVGSPHRLFVGNAVVASRYHRFDENEAAKKPPGLRSFEHGITLARARVWPEALPIMDVWPETAAWSTNPRAKFFGAISTLRSVDAALIVAAGAGELAHSLAGAPELAEPQPYRRARIAGGGATLRNEVDACERAKALRVDTDLTAPRAPGTGAAIEPQTAIDLAARALRAAAMSPSWLPTRIAHADWGTAAAKRVVATAELKGGAYHAHAPQTVVERGGLLAQMGLGGDGPDVTTLLGFDFPIGVPFAYARSARIENFADWFRELDLDSPFFEPAQDVADVSALRPFFPNVPPKEKSPGLKARFHDALGVSSADLLRRCDLRHCDRRAASEMFWTVGPAAVGKSTLAGWKQALRPALAEPGRRYAIWPFDGHMRELLENSDAVIVETYPTEAYRQLELRMGMPGMAKTRKDDRRVDARRLLEWCANNAVIPDDPLLAQIVDGFGEGPGGDDLFDAVVGLFGMIDAVRRDAEPPMPNDTVVRRIEGWMFGQHAVCPRPLPGDGVASVSTAPHSTGGKDPAGIRPMHAGASAVVGWRDWEPGPEATDQERVDALRGFVVGEDGVSRCWWAHVAPEYREYHDAEWGFPVADDKLLFEWLSLETFQGGLARRAAIRRLSGCSQVSSRPLRYSTAAPSHPGPVPGFRGLARTAICSGQVILPARPTSLPVARCG